MEFCINLLLMHCLTFIFFTARLGRKIVTNTRLGRNWFLMDSFALRLCRFFLLCCLCFLVVTQYHPLYVCLLLSFVHCARWRDRTAVQCCRVAMSLQDYQHLGHYVTENLLREVGQRGQLTSIQKTDAMCVWSMSLGLRRPTEPTLQTLVALKLHIGGGLEEGKSQDFFDLFKIFKNHFKKMVAVNSNPPLEHVPALPSSPAEFAAEFPSTWADFSSVHGNDLVAMEERWFLQLTSIKVQIPMRRTHSLVERGERVEGRSAAPQQAAAQVLEQFMELLGGKARPPGMQRRFMEKSPDPRSKLSRATALLDRLEHQVARSTSQAASCKRQKTEESESSPLGNDDSEAHPPVQEKCDQIVAVTPPTKEDAIPRTPPAPTKNDSASFLECAEMSVAALDAALGVQKKPACDQEPVKKTMPTPQKVDPERPDPEEVLKRPACLEDLKTKATAQMLKKPSARIAVQKKPSMALQKKPSMALTAMALPKAPQWMAREYRGGCAKCRYQERGCTPSCWKYRGYAPP